MPGWKLLEQQGCFGPVIHSGFEVIGVQNFHVSFKNRFKAGFQMVNGFMHLIAMIVAFYPALCLGQISFSKPGQNLGLENL